MTKNLTACLQSPELTGLTCGLAVVAVSPTCERLLLTPAWALGLLVTAAMLAAFIVAGAAARSGQLSDPCVKRGGVAGGITILVAGALFLWGVQTQTSPAWPQITRAWLIFAASVMPALLAGSIAAGLGVVCFRRQVESVPPLPELPTFCRWCLRGTLIAGLLTALVAPMIPAPARRADSPQVPVTISIPPKPVNTAPPPPPRELFTYKSPESLKTAPTIAWQIKATRRLGTFQANQAIAFSKDQRFLAGLDGDHNIVVHDLESEGSRRVQSTPFPVLQLAFSPDGLRMFVVMKDDPPKLGVASLENGQFTQLPQPRKHQVPGGIAIWWKEKEVVFQTGSAAELTLNLDTLLLDPAQIPEAELESMRKAVAIGLPANDRWAFGKGGMLTFAERPEIEGTQQWEWRSEPRLVLNDLQRASRRVFLEITPGNGDTYFGPGDGSKIMQIRDGQLSIFYFEPGEIAAQRWKIPMPHGPERMKDADLTRAAMARGELSFLMYAPMVNPLNNQTVGPDRERPKAIMRVLRWEGVEAEVWIEAETQRFEQGDVFADLYVPGEAPRLLSTDLPHPWWVAVPEPAPDAKDVTKLPLRKDLIKELTAEEKERFAEAVRKAEEPLPATSEELAAAVESVTEFITAHHAAASEGRLQDFVNDYANRVDYFANGFVGREFILKDETEYHGKYRYLREKVQGELNILKSSPGKMEVNYTMANEWQRLDNNEIGGGLFKLILTLEHSQSGWKIVRHRANKLK